MCCGHSRNTCLMKSEYTFRGHWHRARWLAQSLLLSCKSCSTLCNPMDCGLLGFSVLGISQTRILEWVAIFFSRESPCPRDWTHISGIGRWILYHWATRAAWHAQSELTNRYQGLDVLTPRLMIHFLCIAIFKMLNISIYKNTTFFFAHLQLYGY